MCIWKDTHMHAHACVEFLKANIIIIGKVMTNSEILLLPIARPDIGCLFRKVCASKWNLFVNFDVELQF